jgi:hypothetical protein
MSSVLKIYRIGAVLLLAPLVLAGCLQDDGGATGPSSDQVKVSESSTDPRLALLTNEMGIPKENLTIVVDPTTRESAYVYVPAPAVSKGKQKERALHGGLAFTMATLDEMVKKNEQKKALAAGGNLRQNAAAKGAHTRWVHWTSLLDVKALTEVRQIKVYLKSTGSDKIGPYWQAAYRSAMVNWNSQATGTAISFTEVADINQSDLIIRGAINFEGLTYVAYLNPSPYVGRIPLYGGISGQGVDIVANTGFENPATGVVHSQKTTAAMASLANILNFGFVGGEGQYWNSGDFTHIPGTVYSDGDSWTPGSSILTPGTTSYSTPALTAADLRAFRTLYPAHGILSKLSNNNLVTVGQAGYTTISTNVNSFQYAGDTVIFLRNDGVLFRRIGVGGANVQIWPGSGSYGTAASFVHSRGYIAVQNTAGNIYGKAGNGSWSYQTASGTIYRVSGDRLAVYYGSMQAVYSKPITAPLTSWNYDWSGWDIHDIQLRNGLLLVADGSEVWAMQDYNGWYQIYSGDYGYAEKLYMSDNLIAMYHTPYGSYEGRVSVFYGGVPYGAWWNGPDPLYSADDVDLCGNNLAFLQQSTYLRVIDFDAWTVHEHYAIPGHDQVAKVQIGGVNCDYVTITDPWQNVWAKYGIDLGTDYFQYQANSIALPQK